MRGKAALVGAILLAGAALVAALLPLARCPDCDDVVRRSIAGGSIVSYEEFLDYLGCPRCGDRGRVTCLSRYRIPPLDPLLKGLIQACWENDRRHDLLKPALSQVALRSNVEPVALCGWKGNPDFRWIPSAGFVRAEGKDFFLVILCDRVMKNQRPDEFPARIILIDANGRCLDKIELSAAGGRWVCFGRSFELPPASDGAVLKMLMFPLESGGPDDPRSLYSEYQVHHGGQSTLIRDIEGERPDDHRTRGVLRLGIQGGKFRIMEPRKAASP